MHFLDTVFIQLFYDQTDSVFCDHFVTGNRQTIQMFDDKSTQGIIILGIQFRIQMIIYVIQMHGTFDDIFPVGNLLDKLVLLLIVFVMDLTDDLLQDILQCDKSGHVTVLIQHNGNVESGILHFHKKIGNTLCLISEMWLPEKMLNDKFLIFVVEQKIFHIDNAHDIILAVPVNRETCEFILAEDLDQFIIGGFHICKSNMDSRHHDVLGCGISKIKHIVDHFLFVGFNDAVLMAYIHDGTEFFLRHGFACRIRVYTHQTHHTSGKEIDDKDHRCHDGHKKFKDRDIAEGDLFRVNGCVVLGGDLAEDQDQNRQDHRYDADHISAKAVCKCGCKGRSRNVHNVVSDENRTEKLGRLVLKNIESHGCTLVSLVCKRAETDLVYRHQRGFVR